MSRIGYYYRRIFHRNKNVDTDNWMFEIVSYKRLQKDFIFIFNNQLAKESIVYMNLTNQKDMVAVLDKLTTIAQSSLREAVFQNARTIKRIN